MFYNLIQLKKTIINNLKKTNMNLDFISYSDAKKKRFYQFLFKEIEAFNNLGANLKITNFVPYINKDDERYFLSYNFSLSIYDILANLRNYDTELKHSYFMVYKHLSHSVNYLNDGSEFANKLFALANKDIYFDFNVKVEAKDGAYRFVYSFNFPRGTEFSEEKNKDEFKFIEEKLNQVFLSLNFTLQKKYANFHEVLRRIKI